MRRLGRPRLTPKLVVIATFLLPILWWYALTRSRGEKFQASLGTPSYRLDAPGSHPSLPQFNSTEEHNAYTQDLFYKCRSLAFLRKDADRLQNELPVHGISCGTNQTTLVILASQWFQAAYTYRTALNRHPTGEMIYAESFLRTLDHWGYSYVFTGRHRGDSGMRRMKEVHDRWTGNVKMVLADPAQVEECWDAAWCTGGDTGIPVWKLFSFWYWDR